MLNSDDISLKKKLMKKYLCIILFLLACLIVFFVGTFIGILSVFTMVPVTIFFLGMSCIGIWLIFRKIYVNGFKQLNLINNLYLNNKIKPIFLFLFWFLIFVIVLSIIIFSIIELYYLQFR